MLHKPEGYVCSNEDPDHATVFHLPTSRPWANCTWWGASIRSGLVLITDDGQWSHRITSPRHGVRRPTTSGWLIPW